MKLTLMMPEDECQSVLVQHEVLVMSLFMIDKMIVGALLNVLFVQNIVVNYILLQFVRLVSRAFKMLSHCNIFDPYLFFL